MPRSLIASDNFNRASLGANWTQINSFYGSMSIATSTVVRGAFAASSDTDRQAARWDGAGSFANDQYASIVLGGFSYQTTGYAIGVIVRASANSEYNTRDHYAAIVCADGPGPTYTTKLYKVIDGVVTPLHSATANWANGDRLELEAEGTTLRVCKNGTPLGGSFTQTDASLASGKPGITGSSNSDTISTGDDWEAGDIVANAPNVPPTILTPNQFGFSAGFGH